MNSRLLICEDEPSVNNLIANQLRSSIPNAHVIQAFSRDEALESLRKYYFGVALIDLNLEGHFSPDWKKSGGVKIVERIKELDYGTIVIVETGSPLTRLAFELARDYGVQDYVAKGENLFEELIAICLSYFGTDRRNVPEGMYTQKTLSGIEDGVERDIWYANCLTTTNIDGNTFFNALNKIVKLYYPLVPRKENCGLVVNGKEKCVSGDFWSLFQGGAIRIEIKNKREVFSVISNQTVLIDETIKNARLVVTRLEDERDEYV